MQTVVLTERITAKKALSHFLTPPTRLRRASIVALHLASSMQFNDNVIDIIRRKYKMDTILILRRVPQRVRHHAIFGSPSVSVRVLLSTYHHDMVKRKSAAAPRDEEDAQEYASDSIPELPVKRKTAKTPTAKKPRYDKEEEEEEDQPPRKRTSKSAAKPTSSKLEESEDQDVYVKANGEGEKYIDLGKKRRATVRSFKGTVFLDIREYYGAEGDEKPGKKGISLSREQWQCLKNASDAIDTLFKKMTK